MRARGELGSISAAPPCRKERVKQEDGVAPLICSLRIQAEIRNSATTNNTSVSAALRVSGLDCGVLVSNR